MTLHHQPDILGDAEAAFKGAVADPVTFLPVAVGVVGRARVARHPEALVVALRAQAWAEHLLLRNREARRLLDAALGIASRHALDGRVVEVLVNRAAVHHELGRIPAAQRDLDRASVFAVGPHRAQVGLQQAVLHHNLGRLETAEQIYREHLADPDCPVDVRGKMLNNLGHLLAQCGRPADSLRVLDEAADVATEVGATLVAVVATTRAWAHLQAGRLGDSLRGFEAARTLWEAAGLPLADFAMEYGDALVDCRLLVEAAEVTDRAARELTEHRADLMAAEATLRLARITMLLGRADPAVDAAERAVANLRRQRRTVWAAGADVTAVQALVLAGRADPRQLSRARRAGATLERFGVVGGAVDAHLVTALLAQDLGRTATARAAWSRAFELSLGAPVLVRLKGRIAAARAACGPQAPAEVLRHCRAGLDDLAGHRAALPSMELRALASGHGAELGTLGLRALLNPSSGARSSGTPSPVRVLGWLERTRAAALVAVDPPVPPELQAHLATLRATYVELREARRGQGAEPAELRARLAALEARIRRSAWGSRTGSAAAATGSAATGSTAAPLSAARLREALGPAVLAEYGALDGRMIAVVLDARRARLVELGPVAAVTTERDALQFALRRLTRSPRSAAAVLSVVADTIDRLAALLVDPLRVEAGRPLVVVPSGELHGVSWSPLHDGPVTLAPTAAWWAASRSARPDPHGEPVALVAGPDLPGAVAEVAELGRLHSGRDGSGPATLLPPASTTSAVTDLLAGAALAHVACHGLLRTDNPTFSALHLSDGPLTVHELAAAGVPAHRIVLAACESGAQVSYDGDEVLGLVSALMARGTAGVVAATVPVPDGESVPLMRGLHREVASGRTLGEALHTARRAAGRTARDFEGSPTDVVAWCAYTAYGAA